MIQKPVRPCARCGHSIASHREGVTCLLCACVIREETQESFTFRNALPREIPGGEKDKNSH